MEIPKYHWNWNDKLSASPFRKEIKRLKQDNKNNPSNKSLNNEFKRILKAKEKDLLAEFGKKCDQAKIWINIAKQDTANENYDNPALLKQIEYQRKKEKIETIDKFWEELLCVETVFLQNEKIKRQNEQIANMEKQLIDAKKKLDLLNKSKNNQQQITQKITTTTTTKVIKKKKNKTKKDKEEYMGLIGYFNKPRKEKKTNKTKKTNIDNIDNIDNMDNNNKTLNGHSFLSYSYIPKIEDDGEEFKNYEKRNNDKPKINKPKINKPKKQKKSMKGGFLNSETMKNGLYDDKKAPEEMSVDELNAKNEAQIKEMGLKDATNNPFFTWERPKMEQREKAKQEGKDVYGHKGDAAGLTQFLDAQARAADDK